MNIAVPATVHSVCPHDCPSVCALEVERIDARTIGRVRGAGGNSYTAGVVCAKVARYVERVHHPDRLREPLQRVGAKGDGTYRPIPWEAALDEVAEAFRRAAERHGTEAVWPYFYAGTMGLVQRDGINRLRYVMRYSRQKDTICTTLCDSGWLAGVGAFRGTDAREMADSDLIIAWGGNMVATQVNVMTHVTRARKTRGARFVAIDPYRNGTAEAADLHLMLRPGTDGALACAVMHVLFRDGFADRDYLARHTDCPTELEAHVASRTPRWAAAITGLAENEIEAFAKLYGATRRSFIRVGYGFSRSRNGAANVHAVTCLPAITGAWQYRGGGALYSNRSIYRLDRTLIHGLDAVDHGIRRLDMSRIGPVLTGDRGDLGDGPPVTAMLIQNTNPVAVAPQSATVRQGFARDDLFVCVHEQFMTDTARLADIVLPATSFLEHDDLYQSGGHSHLQLGPKVIEPVGEARSNHAVIQGLAARLGAQHPGFCMSALEIIDATLKASGWPGVDVLRDIHWVDCQPDFATSHFLNGFGTPDGRFHFRPDWSRIGPDHAVMPSLPDHVATIEAADAEHPFRLVTAPARQFLNTSFTETPTSVQREGRPTALIHPDDAVALGLSDGAAVRLGNRRGSVVVHARPFAGLRRGVVIVESVWPAHSFVEGRPINTLVGAEAGPPNGGAVFHDTAVWIRAA
ncbi:MAG: molybdopterin oxidoreductase family protein [Alphaproteobacteria bacterium]|nr:molybdopterin oxidoreductase family protein [Alphaproteobacteria bacterium]